MFTYVVRRILVSIPLLILISIIIFIILNNMPGGPLAPYLQNPHITPADIERLRANLGLTPPHGVPQPVWDCIRYFKWLGHVVTGDFGYSVSESRPVLESILGHMPATLELMGTSLFFALVFGIAAGIFSAVRPYSFADYLITTLAFFGQSMPVFWFALMLQLAFAVHGIPLPGGYEIRLPSASISSSDTFDLGDRIQHLILPVIVLSLFNLAVFSRFMRSSLIEVTRTDYVRTAAAKGLDPRTILFKHEMKNALMPVVTVLALTMPSLVGGAVLTETLFAWPGAGRMFINALGQGDIALLLAYLMLSAFVVVFANIAADIVYAWLDPRVSYE